MAQKKERDSQDAAPPNQEDEADILDEVGAVRDEGGQLVVDEATIREVGAVDPTSVRENRRINSVVNKKRANVKNVPFGTDDALTAYETLIQYWAPNTIDISMRRLTGTPLQETIKTRPRGGAELMEALKTVHNMFGGAEAEYEVKFFDTNAKKYRGTCRIALPDTRPPGQQGQQPVYQPPQPGPPPTQPMSPPALDPMAMFRQMFELVTSIQPQPQPQSGWPQPQPMQPTMPQPPTSPDPASMMKWFQEMFALVRQTQPAPQPPLQMSPQPQPQANPAMQGPTMPAPRGMMWAWMPEMAAFALVPAPNAAPPAGPMYRSPGPRYPQGDPNERPPYMSSQSQPQRSASPNEHFREMIGTVRTARAFAEEMGSITGQYGGGGASGHVDDEATNNPDGPVEVVDTGKGKLIYGREDGSLRGWDTLLTNAPDMLKWIGEQADKISKAAVERQRREAAQQLPQGYVELRPGYEPPPGYAAVPIDRIPPEHRQGLAPPPTNVPPPITRHSWDDAPTEQE